MNVNTSIIKSQLREAVIGHFLRSDKSICTVMTDCVHAGYFVDSETGGVTVYRSGGSIEQPEENSEGENFIGYIDAGYITLDMEHWEDLLVDNFGASQAGVDHLRRVAFELDYDDEDSVDFDDGFLELLAREPAVRRRIAEHVADCMDFGEDAKVVRKAMRRRGIGLLGYTLARA